MVQDTRTRPSISADVDWISWQGVQHLYLMMMLDCDDTLPSTSQPSTAIGSSLCSLDWCTGGAGGAVVGAGSSLLPCLLGIVGGTCLLVADAAGRNVHRDRSDWSIVNESCDCSVSESGGGGSTSCIGGCKAAAACAAKVVVPVVERCRLECVARDEGDLGAAAVAVGTSWLWCASPDVASDGGWVEDTLFAEHFSSS